jgi:hypothetical protein
MNDLLWDTIKEIEKIEKINYLDHYIINNFDLTIVFLDKNEKTIYKEFKYYGDMISPC